MTEKNTQGIKLTFLAVAIFLFFIASAMNASAESLILGDYSISYTYDNAESDSYFTLRIEITNNDNSAKEIKLKLDEDDPFEIESPKTWETSINASETVSKTFTIYVDEDAESKTHKIKFKLEDEDDDWEDNFKIKVASNSAEISLSEITSSPEKITPGKDGVKLSIKIKNSGDYDAEDVTATIELPNGFTPSGSYSDVIYAGDIASGDTETLDFYFDIDEKLKEQDYSANLEVEYQSDGEDEKKSFEIPIPIFSIPQFEISGIEKIADITPGAKTAKIKVGIKNTGKDTKDVTLKVYERSDQPFTFSEKSVYIGSLNSNQIGYGVFEFEVDSDAVPMSYFIDFQVRSINGDEVIVSDVTSTLDVDKGTANIAKYVLYSCIALTAIVGGIIFLKKRRH